jgi:hypothetical protein
VSGSVWRLRGSSGGTRNLKPRSSKLSRSTSPYLRRSKSSGRVLASWQGPRRLLRAFVRIPSHSHNNSSAPKTAMAPPWVPPAHWSSSSSLSHPQPTRPSTRPLCRPP